MTSNAPGDRVEPDDRRRRRGATRPRRFKVGGLTPADRSRRKNVGGHLAILYRRV